MSSEPYASPSVWGKAKRGLTDEWFAKEVSWCRSRSHLQAAIQAEIERGNQPDREVRRERIGRLNERVQQLKRVDK